MCHHIILRNERKYIHNFMIPFLSIEGGGTSSSSNIKEWTLKAIIGYSINIWLSVFTSSFAHKGKL